MPAFRQADLLVAASALLLGASPVAGPLMWHAGTTRPEEKANTSFPGVLDGNKFPAMCHNGDIPPDALSLVEHTINRRTELFGPLDGESSETLNTAQHGGVDFSKAADFVTASDEARGFCYRMIVAEENISKEKNASPVVSSVIGHVEVTLALEKGLIAAPDRETFVQLFTGTAGLAAERAEEEGHKPVIMNFSNGELPCGGYLNGTLQQEEALCLEYPRLLPALWQAKQCGFYPHGSAAGRMAFSESPRTPIEAVTDVIFTPAIPRERKMENNWRQKLAAVTPEQGQGRGHAFVSAAAPKAVVRRRPAGASGRKNTNLSTKQYSVSGGAADDTSYMLQQMETAFLAPKLFDPTIEAFIGGPWGADGFGTPPDMIARLWAQIWNKHDGLYKYVTLAVPAPTVFPRLLRENIDNTKAFIRFFHETDDLPAGIPASGKSSAGP